MSGLAGAVGKVVQGHRGRLFLGRQDGFDLGRFTDGSALPPSLLAQWRATLTRRGAELSSRGIPYFFMIAPDAPTVHFEDLPDDYPGPYRTPGHVFREAMGDIPGVAFVFPVDALRAARGGIDVYQRTDSHWTMFGSGVAYRELMKAVQRTVHCHIVPENSVRYSFRRSFGDLGSLCDPEQSSEVPVAAFDGPEPERIVERSGAQRQATTATRMAGAPKLRVLAFRDSFMTDLSPYLARSFSDLLMLGTTNRVMLDAVDDWSADVVISEVAERRLVAFQSDHQCERHDWLYLKDHSGDIGRAILRALTLMPGDPAQAAAIVSRHAAECLIDEGHAYSAAIVLEAAGDHAGATRFANHALDASLSRTDVLALSARLRLSAGQPEQAARLLVPAVEAAPWNGALRELHIYSLIQAGQQPQARIAAEAALIPIEDHANLWYWAAILREANGDKAGASIALSRAMALDPDSPAYLELHHRLGNAPSAPA